MILWGGQLRQLFKEDGIEGVSETFSMAFHIPLLSLDLDWR